MKTRNTPIHPGVAFKQQYLNGKGDITSFARRHKISRSYLGEICQGKRPVNAKIAMIFAKRSQEPADLWAMMQAAYDVHFCKNRGYWRR